MKIAYTVREFRPRADPISRYVCNLARQLAAYGHQIYLITESSISTPHVMLVATRPGPPGWDYFTPEQSYADRVYRTISLLHRKLSLDVVEFADRGAEGLTTIRAKRLLGEFARTGLVVRVHAPTALTGQPPSYADYRRSILIYAEEYCVQHADLVTAPSEAGVEYGSGMGAAPVLLARDPLGPDDLVPVTPVERRPERHVIFGGTLDPAGGVDVFLAAAEKIVEQDAGFTFTLFGRHTSYRHFGAAYAQHLPRLITPPLCGKVRMLDPAVVTDRAAVWRGARYCVFPSRWDGCPPEAVEAMSHGCVVVCGDQGGVASLPRHGESGLRVDPRDPMRLSELLLRMSADPVRMSRRATAQARRGADPIVVADRILSAYRDISPRPRLSPARRRPTVSVIIPVFSQGRLIEETLASVRASTYEDLDIIVVNDGATDTETLAAFGSLDGVHKVCKPNGGPGSAYNAGLAVTRGDLILPLDGDDKIHPRYLATAVQALARNPELAYVTCYVRYFGVFDVVHVPVGHVRDVMLFVDTEGKRSKLFRRAALEEVGGFDEQLPTLDDWEIQLRMARHGLRGDVLPRVLFYYRRHARSLTLSLGEERFVAEDKHADVVKASAPALVAHLLRLWKGDVEFSRSARWRRESADGGLTGQ